MKYACLNKDCYALQGYSLTALRLEDMLLIKEWRNDQIPVLRQNEKLTDEDQLNYYFNKVQPSFASRQPAMILFSFLLDGECIGYGGLTNIDWVSRRAEVSFLLNTGRGNDPVQYRKDFTAFLTLIKGITFQEIDLNRLFTETFDLRPHHLKILEENGFEFEGRLKQHVFIGGRFVDSLIHGLLRECYDIER